LCVEKGQQKTPVIKDYSNQECEFITGHGLNSFLSSSLESNSIFVEKFYYAHKFKNIKSANVDK